MEEPKINFNPKLFWDYDIKEADLSREKVLIFYLGRILNNGTARDIREIPEELITRYLARMHLSRRVRKFWEFYF